MRSWRPKKSQIKLYTSVHLLHPASSLCRGEHQVWLVRIEILRFITAKVIAKSTDSGVIGPLILEATSKRPRWRKISIKGGDIGPAKFPFVSRVAIDQFRLFQDCW